MSLALIAMGTAIGTLGCSREHLPDSPSPPTEANFENLSWQEVQDLARTDILTFVPRVNSAAGPTFASDSDRTMIRRTKDLAVRIASDAPRRLTQQDCVSIAAQLDSVGSPNDLYSAIGRVTDPPLQTLLWSHRQSLGFFVSSCCSGQPETSGAFADLRLKTALIQERLESLSPSELKGR